MAIEMNTWISFNRPSASSASTVSSHYYFTIILSHHYRVFLLMWHHMTNVRVLLLMWHHMINDVMNYFCFENLLSSYQYDWAICIGVIMENREVEYANTFVLLAVIGNTIMKSAQYSIISILCQLGNSIWLRWASSIDLSISHPCTGSWVGPTLADLSHTHRYTLELKWAPCQFTESPYRLRDSRAL